MSLRSQVISGVRWNAASLFLTQICTWSLTIFTMRLLSPGDYGLLAVASVFVSFIALFAELGIGPALIQKTELDDFILRQALGFSLLVNSILCLLLMAAAPLIGIFYADERLVLITRVISCQFILNAFTVVPNALLNRALDFKKISIFNIIGGVLTGVTTVLLAYNGYGVWALVSGGFVNVLVRIAGLNYLHPFFRLPCFSMSGLSALAGFGGKVTLSRILWYIYSQADVFIVGKILGLQSVGYYSLAMNVATLPLQKLSGVINNVAFPAYARIQKDKERIGNYFFKSVRLTAIISFPVLWGISSISPELVRVVIGVKWLPAIFPLQIITLVMPLNMIHNLISPMAYGVGRPEIALHNVVMGVVLMPAAFLFGSMWGLKGVCLAWLIMYPVLFYLNMSRLIKDIGIGGFIGVLKVIFKPIIASLIMYGVVYLVSMFVGLLMPGVVTLSLMIMTGGLSYGALIYLLDKEGIKELWGMIRG